jgi:hypothetical protein
LQDDHEKIGSVRLTAALKKTAQQMISHKDHEKKDFQVYQSTLPSYFHNINGRTGLNQTMEKSLREVAATSADIRDNYSSFVNNRHLAGQDQRRKQSKFIYTSLTSL